MSHADAVIDDANEFTPLPLAVGSWAKLNISTGNICTQFSLFFFLFTGLIIVSLASNCSDADTGKRPLAGINNSHHKGNGKRLNFSLKSITRKSSGHGAQEKEC
jgi:hypothetical protein